MKILILGAGQVGGTLAENLANEANDITVIDSDSTRLRELQDRLDIRTVQGMASFPTVLRQAGAEDGDMVIAVTNSDEVNMVACQVSKLLYKTPTTICRVRANAYLAKPELFYQRDQKKDLDSLRGFPIDVLISPEHLVTKHITRLIDTPARCKYWSFPRGLFSWSPFGRRKAAHWLATSCRTCVAICPKSKHGSPPFSGKTGRSCLRGIR